MMGKLSSLMENEPHPDPLSALGSSFRDRLLNPRGVRERYRHSFPPAAVRVYNKALLPAGLTHQH